MRMRKLFVGLLVLGLAVGMLGMVSYGQKHSANADDKVTWTIQEYIELTIDTSSYDFGTIDAGVDTVSDVEANTRSFAATRAGNSITPWQGPVVRIYRSLWKSERASVTPRLPLATLCLSFARWGRMTTA